MNNIADRLRSGIIQGLPGTAVQWEMASSDRMVRNFPKSRSSDSGFGAVLILIYPVAGSYYTVLIQRPDYDGVHGGQIGFPGGKMEEGDINLTDTALRESCEEIGICRDNLSVIGLLTPLFIPVSNIEVTPVVGYSAQQPSFNISKEEVQYIIEVKLNYFLNKEVVREKHIDVSGGSINVKYYDYENHVIWGATAMMLHELLVISEREGITFLE